LSVYGEATTQRAQASAEKTDIDRSVAAICRPDHDWSNHAADAFGLMAVSYEEPSSQN
jgi:phage terminase large subunit